MQGPLAQLGDQRPVALHPGGGGQEPIGPEAQAQDLLQQVGALQEQPLLFAAAAPLVQGPQPPHQGIAPAGNQLKTPLARIRIHPSRAHRSPIPAWAQNSW